MQSYRAIRSRT